MDNGYVLDHIFKWSSKDDVFHDYSLCYSGGGAMKILQRDGGDHVEFFYYKGVLVNNSGCCVIAAGGIPDMKVRKDLLRDPARCQKAMDDAYWEVWGSPAIKEAIRQALKKQWFSSGAVSEQSGNMDRQPLAMIEVNIRTRSSSSHELKDINMEK